MSLGFLVVSTNLAKSPSVSLARDLLGKVKKGVDMLPANHVCSFVDVGNTVEETLDASDTLSEVGSRVVSVV
jgi:hypothetical protein